MNKLFYPQKNFNCIKNNCSTPPIIPQNIVYSLKNVEYFLCTFNSFLRYVKLYKLLK